MKSTFIFAFALTSPGRAQQPPSPVPELVLKYELFNSYSLGLLNEGPTRGSGGFLGLPHVNFTIRKLTDGTIPNGCEYANYWIGQETPADACPRGNIEVYDIEYNDCRVPTRACRCTDSPVTINAIAQNIGKLPINSRQNIRTISAFRNSAGGGCRSRSNGADFWFQGDCAGDVQRFVHELVHNLDCQVGFAKGLNQWWSGYPDPRQEWVDVNVGDICVPSTYAKTAYIENFAEVGVLVAYQHLVAPLEEFGVWLGCMPKQLQKVTELLGGYFSPSQSGQQCTQAFRQGTAVCVSEEAKAAGLCQDLDVDGLMETELSGITWVDAERLVAQCIP